MLQPDAVSRFLPMPPSPLKANTSHDIFSIDVNLRSLNRIQINNDRHVSVTEPSRIGPPPEDSFSQAISESVVPLARHRLLQMTQQITLNIMLVGQSHSGIPHFLEGLQRLFPCHSLEQNTHCFQVSSFFLLRVNTVSGYKPEEPRQPWLDSVLSQLDSQMQHYHEQKKRVHRPDLKPALLDTRTHLCLYFFQGPFIRQDDAQNMKLLAPHVNLIPLLALGDNYTAPETDLIKQRMRVIAKDSDIGWYDIWAVEEVQSMERAERDRLRGGPFGESPPFQMVGGLSRPHGQSSLEDPGHSDFLFFVSLLVNHLVLDLRESTHCKVYRRWREREEQNRPGEGRDYSAALLLLSSLLMFGGLGGALLLKHHHR